MSEHKEEHTELTREEQLSIIMDQYKETASHRRHYSNLRFALFPVYFAIQYGLVQLAFKVENTALPIAIYAIAGILSTYVFWTIEERILQYYGHLSKVGEELESKLTGRMISHWPKATFKSDTRRSIQFVYLVFSLFWAFFVVKGVWAYFMHF